MMAEPKVKKAEPHFTVDKEMLPQIEDWEVGKHYRLSLEVEQVGLSKGDPYATAEADSKKMEARFRIISAKAVGAAKKESPEPKTQEEKKPLKTRFKEAKAS